MYDPTKIVAVGRLLLKDLQRCDLFRHASAMSYVTVFSIIPSLAAVTAILSSFSPMLSKDRQIFNVFGDLFTGLTPSAISGIIIYIKGMLGTIDFKALGASGIIVLFFSLAFLLRQIEIAFNRIWMVRKNRNLFKRFLYFWTYSTLSLFLLSLGLAFFANFKLDSILQDTALNLQSQFSFMSILWNWFICFLVFTFLYKIIPNCRVAFTDAMAGGIVATICFQIITKAYGYFISSVADYRALYGTLAALPTFLLWLYLSWLIIMLGALFAWRWQQGFPIEQLTEEKLQTQPQNSVETFQERVWVTLVGLIMVYKTFENNNTSVSALDISQNLDIPIETTADQVEMLCKLKLITMAADDSEKTDPINRSLLPTQPPNKLNLKSILQQLFSSPELADHKIEEQIKIIFKKLKHKNYNDLGNTYLSELLETPAK